MEVVKMKQSSGADGVLHLDIPTHYYNCDTNVVVIVEKAENEKSTPEGYDFSDLSGRLQWDGDALSEQRRLRDEW